MHVCLCLHVLTKTGVVMSPGGEECVDSVLQTAPVPQQLIQTKKGRLEQEKHKRGRR